MQTTVQVTATRFGEPVVEVPGAISVVTADELRAGGAVDLRAALALAQLGAVGHHVAYTQTSTDSVRGFIDAGDTPQPWTASTNADLESFEQL